MSDLSGNKFVNKYGEPLKPKAERVKEAVKLMTSMRVFGIPTNDGGYQEIKERLDEWIQGGEKWSGTIHFSHIENQAELELPVKPGREIMMKLIAPKIRRK